MSKGSHEVTESAVARLCEWRGSNEDSAGRTRTARVERGMARAKPYTIRGRKREMSKKSGFIQEFKKFILRGNVMDMAVGVIVGGAFTAIVTSLNQDILTPVLAIFGGTDFSNLYVKLGSGDTAPVLMYGNFITAVINFLITAFVIFCLVKFINKLGDTLHHKEETPAAPTTKKCPFCKSEIAIDATRCPHCTSKLDEQ